MLKNSILIVYSDDKWSSDESDSEQIYSYTEENSHGEIINKCDFGQRHLIDAHISSSTNLLQSSKSGEVDTHIDKSVSDVVSSGINDDHPKQQKKQTYPTMLKLISGTLVGSENYSNIYLDRFYEDDINSSSTNDSKLCKQDSHTRDVPTLPEIARKVAKLEKINLDEKQYISYKMIACTFLLGLVRDGRDL